MPEMRDQRQTNLGPSAEKLYVRRQQTDAMRKEARWASAADWR